MVTENHYRWDFIGLSTDEKPTPATSEKVVDGSTFYCSDTSKLYVYCKDNWYERKALSGGGGGGGDINVVQTTGTSTTDVMSQKAVTDALASAGGGVTILTTSDYNYDSNNDGTNDKIGVWLLSPGVYEFESNTVAENTWYDNANTYPGNNTGVQAITISDASGGAFKNIFGYFGANINSSFLGFNIIVMASNGTNMNFRRILGDSSTIDNLTSTSTWRPLSANQGKTLKDLVDGLVITNAGAPTTATVGTVGQLLEDTTNGDLYICTDATNPYVWEQVGAGGGSITPVQTTGASQTDVMSQDATTKLIYPDIANSPYKMVIGEGVIDGTNKGLAINGVLNSGINGGSIAIGAPDGNTAQIGGNGRASQSIAIGATASAGRGMQSVAIGANACTNSGQNDGDNTALGFGAYAGNGSATSTVALGAYAKTTRTGEVNIGAGTSGTGYNSTNYRVLGGVHDGQDAHDAATLAQGNTLSTSAPTTSTVGVLGQLYTDTTNMHTYQCTAISGDTYTWTQRW